MKTSLFKIFTFTIIFGITGLFAQTSTMAWENIGLTNGASITTATTTTVDGVTFTFSRRFIGTASNLPTAMGFGDRIMYNSGQTGNHTGFADMRFDKLNAASTASHPNDRLVFTVKFSQPVTGVTFSLLDIDASGSGTGVSWKDAVELYLNAGQNAKTTAGVTITLGGSGVINDNETYMNGWEGNSSVSATGTAANVNINFGANAVDSFTVVFFSSDDAQLNPTAQFIGISDITFNTPAVLPVDLASFTAAYANERVVLNWATITEVNNSHFTIEKSSDGADWKFFANVEGNGNSQKVNTYSIEDFDVTSGKIFYRLSQIDFDGTIKIIGFATVKIEDNDFGGIYIYPNPSNGDFYIKSDKKLSSDSHVEIYDIQGRRVQATTIMASNGEVYVSGLSRGLYLVKVLGKTLTEPSMDFKVKVD